MNLAIETSKLEKTFGKTQALASVDLAIPRGSVYGLLGPNGAGKTTTIRILATLLRPSGGRALVLGHDVVREARAVREKVSLTGQFASIDDDLTGHENLTLIARLLGLGWREARERSAQLLDAFGLLEAGKRQVRTFSGGMRRRLDISASLVVTPQVLFLDEPTTGLDLRSRGQVWDIVRAIAAEGTTVLLTTQYLDEADRLADRLAVIDHGRLIAEGTSAELKSQVGSTRLHVRVRQAEIRAGARAVLADALRTEVSADGDGVSLVATVESDGDAALALASLSKAGIGVADFSLGQPSLDDVFLAITGHAARTDEPDRQPEVSP